MVILGNVKIKIKWIAMEKQGKAKWENRLQLFFFFLEDIFSSNLATIAGKKENNRNVILESKQ